MQAYQPLAHGDPAVLKDSTIQQVAIAHNKSTAQVALRWVTQQGIVVVTASTKASHLKGDLDIFDFTLTDAEMATLTKI